jgi:hypothetical protein
MVSGRYLQMTRSAKIVILLRDIILATVVTSFLFVGSSLAATVRTSTTSNAIGVLVNGTDVGLFVPYSTDNSLKMGAVMKIIESAPGAPASKTAFFKAGFANSCATSPATSIAVCSAAFGSSYISRPTVTGQPLRATKGGYKVAGFKSGVTKLVHFTGGSCANCGTAIDDALGGVSTAIVSTSRGYLPVQLSPFQIQPILTTNGEAISGNFGYDPVNHRILSPNYQILNLKHFQTGTPHYQIIDVSGGAAFDLSDNNAFFNATGTCATNTGGTVQRDALPDAGAYDITTGIAYGTFRSPADCISADTVEDIALFDMTQATFDTGTATWSTAGKQIQTLSEMNNLSNGITGIAVVPGQNLAIVADRFELSGGAGGFGALSLPTTSGSGIPAIQDWVQAEMPNDPSGKRWAMSFEPNGLTAYTSPNSGNGMGVIINRTHTYAAVIAIQALLSATRQNATMHTLSSSVDLVGDGIVRFVNIRPGM